MPDEINANVSEYNEWLNELCGEEAPPEGFVGYEKHPVGGLLIHYRLLSGKPLIPNDLAEKLFANWRESRGEIAKDKDIDHVPVVKLFHVTTGARWLLTEVDPDRPNIAFGLADWGPALGGVPELGYIDLDEIAMATAMKLPIERDLYIDLDKPLSAYLDEWRGASRAA